MWQLCSLSGHRRSAKRATRNFHTQQWESVCKHCGVPMLRIGPGEWRTRNESDPPERPLLAWRRQSLRTSAVVEDHPKP